MNLVLILLVFALSSGQSTSEPFEIDASSTTNENLDVNEIITLVERTTDLNESLTERTTLPYVDFLEVETCDTVTAMTFAGLCQTALIDTLSVHLPHFMIHIFTLSCCCRRGLNICLSEAFKASNCTGQEESLQGPIETLRASTSSVLSLIREEVCPEDQGQSINRGCADLLHLFRVAIETIRFKKDEDNSHTLEDAESKLEHPGRESILNELGEEKTDEDLKNMIGKLRIEYGFEDVLVGDRDRPSIDDVLVTTDSWIDTDNETFSRMDRGMRFLLKVSRILETRVRYNLHGSKANWPSESLSTSEGYLEDYVNITVEEANRETTTEYNLERNLGLDNSSFKSARLIDNQVPSTEFGLDDNINFDDVDGNLSGGTTFDTTNNITSASTTIDWDLIDAESLNFTELPSTWEPISEDRQGRALNPENNTMEPSSSSEQILDTTEYYYQSTGILNTSVPPTTVASSTTNSILRAEADRQGRADEAIVDNAIANNFGDVFRVFGFNNSSPSPVIPTLANPFNNTPPIATVATNATSTPWTVIPISPVFTVSSNDVESDLMKVIRFLNSSAPWATPDLTLLFLIFWLTILI